jgi:hypothetical protein
MPNHTRSTTEIAADVPSVSIDVEVHGRWEALALSEALRPYHSFLVHHEGQRWLVHARVPGCHDESLDDALRTLEEWRSEHGSSGTPCWIGGERHELRMPERT